MLLQRTDRKDQALVPNQVLLDPRPGKFVEGECRTS